MSLQGRIVYVVVKWDDYDMREGTLERMQVVKSAEWLTHTRAIAKTTPN